MSKHKKIIKSCCYVTIGFVFTLIFASQVYSTPFQFGHYSMASHGGRASLRASFSGTAGLHSFGFVGRVGGVNFESTAFLNAQLKDDSVTIDYVPENEDGKRLKIFIGNYFLSFLRYLGSFGESIYTMTGNKIATPLIYDWQLKPIAEYAADSENSGVVSLFGEGEDRENNFYIEYHPAFEDTVLGLRLFQADIMLINPDELAALPKQDEKVLLEKGEIEANPDSFNKAIDEVKSILKKNDIQSWVLTDVKHVEGEPKDGEISMGDNIKINVNPYYYFWRGESDNPEIKEEQKKAFFIVLTLELIESEIEQVSSSNNEAKMQELNEKKIELKNELNNIEEKMKEKVKIIPVNEAIKELKNSRLLSELNPAVFDAVNKTAQYAALFRLVKKDNSSNWSDFIEEINTVQISKIETPSIWAKN
ncbi:MAG: hypothetical protein ACXVLQ_18370 [Bacteriovorax sp.]